MSNLTAQQMDLRWAFLVNLARNAMVTCPLDQLLELQAAYDRGIDFGPYIDPTAYIEAMNNPGVAENGELLKATIAYVETVKRIHEARAARKAGRQ